MTAWPGGIEFVTTPLGVASALLVLGRKTVNLANTPYTVAKDDVQLVVDLAAGNAQVNLPTAAIPRMLFIARIDATANTLTIAAPAGQTINGAASITLSGQWTGAILFPISATAWVCTATGASSSSTGTFRTITVADTPYTWVAADDTVGADCSGGAVAGTLPTPVGASGRKTQAVKLDTSGNAFTLTTPAGAIGKGGQSTFVLNLAQQALSLQSDGTDWVIL